MMQSGHKEQLAARAMCVLPQAAPFPLSLVQFCRGRLQVEYQRLDRDVNAKRAFHTPPQYLQVSVLNRTWVNYAL